MEKGILHWEKIPKAMSKESWMKITADGAPPGVYRPNMSKEDMFKWKAKLINGDDRRVEIRKTFQWMNKKKHPHSKNYASQVLIVVRMNPKDDPDVLVSMNSKMALSHAECIMLQMAIEEAKNVLSKIV